MAEIERKSALVADQISQSSGPRGRDEDRLGPARCRGQMRARRFISVSCHEGVGPENPGGSGLQGQLAQAAAATAGQLAQFEGTAWLLPEGERRRGLFQVEVMNGTFQGEINANRRPRVEPASSLRWRRVG